MQSAFKPLVLLLSAALMQQAAASGYHFGTQSVTSQGTANSSAAEAADATTIFSNPAGLSKLQSHEISTAVNIVAPHIKYRDAEAKHLTGQPVSGSNSGKITKDAVVAPHVYGAYKLNDRATLGLAVYVPFGSSTEYAKDSVLRYNMNKLGLTTIAVEPVVAVKATDKHAFGAGLIAQHSSAELRKFADWGAPRGAAGKMDGYAEVKGKDWGFGYQLSWLYDINDRARVGVNYRSKVEHKLKGTAEWKTDNPAMAAARAATVDRAGFVPKEDASVKIITPESLSVHGMFKANDKLNLFGDVTWTRHSRFNRAELVFENPKVLAAPPAAPALVTARSTVITPDWRDTVKVAAGASYQISEPLQLRAGLAFDQSPVRNANSRMNTLPDGNRIWFSAGVKYALNKNHIVDAAYSHIHINDTAMKSPAASGKDVDSKGPSSAKFNNYANIVGVQYTYRF